MSKGFVKVSHSGNGDVAYYLREGECMTFKHPQGYDKETILQHWEEIEKNEKLGNKDLGIRGRHDARVRTNYILSMPNSLSPNECIDRVQSIIDKTPIKDCIYTTVVHKGEKDGITNQHVHLLVNERILSTQKKDREMQRKEWLDKSFKSLYEKEFKVEFSEGQTVVPRERINQGLFEVDRKASRQGIKAHNSHNWHKVMGDALLIEELQSFEKAFFVDQERTKQSSEQQTQVHEREQERLLTQNILSLSPSFAKEQEEERQEIKLKQALEKERIAAEKEALQQSQEVKKEKIKQVPRIQMKP
jgi:hypothetical protein